MERNKIYIVDDDANIRKTLVWTLQDLLSPLTHMTGCDNGESAYKDIIGNHENVKLVFTDYNMPKMNGVELIEKCYALDSDINFIAMSGGEPGKFSGKDIEQLALKAGAKEFLEKPFGIRQIQEILNKYYK